jgi:hypothetical protein
MKFSSEKKRLLIYQVEEEWFAFGPPAFQAEIAERIGRGEKPCAFATAAAGNYTIRNCVVS